MNEFQANVITQFEISCNEVFGPIPSYPGIPDVSTLIGLGLSENKIIDRSLKIDTRETFNKIGGLDWMLHVQTARDPLEQNLELFAKDGRDYYRAIRNIEAGEELFVWFTKEYAQILGMPEIQTCYVKGDKNYVCHYCNESFRFSYPLLSHLVFGCATRKKIHGLDNNFKTIFPTSAGNDLIYECRKSDKTVIKDYSIEYLTNNYQKSSGKIISFYPLLQEEEQNKTMDMVNNNEIRLHRPFLNENSEEKAFCNENNKNEVKRKETVMVKRKIDSEDKLISSKRSHSVVNIVSSSLRIEVNSSTPESSPPKINEEKMDHNQNLQKTVLLLDESNDNGSAFKKVNKISRPFLESHVTNVSSISSPPSFTNSDVMYPAPIKSLFTNMPFNVPLIGGNASANGIRPAMTPTTTRAMTTSSLPSAFMSTKLGDSSQVSFIHSLRPTLPATPDNLENRPFYAPASFTDNRIAMGYPYPKSFGSSLDNFVTKPNPQATTLPPSVITLGFPAQNWCAKCNASFRMTSDLVYHMRSHHKRDPDPNKKKRDDKLKCSVCNETFRERHHLTRHMTSHQ